MNLLSFKRDEFVTPLSNFFDDLFNSEFPQFSADIISRGSYPKMDILDSEKNIEIIAEIPGMKKEDLRLDLVADVLTISGSKNAEYSEYVKGKTFISRELKHSSFSRSIKLEKNLDSDQIKSTFENGVLKIYIPKIKDEQKTLPKSIEIE